MNKLGRNYAGFAHLDHLRSSSLDLDRIGPGEAIDNAIRRRKGEGGTVCLEGLPDIRLSGPRRTALDT